MSHLVHGVSPSLYDRHGCRCGPCRKAHNDRVRRNRAARRKNPVSHGTRSSYDAGCRCEACRLVRQQASAVHLDTGGGAPRCGHPHAFRLSSDEEAVTCRGCLLRMSGALNRQRRLNGIEDYLFIGGDRLSAAKAAERLGVTRRTVQRYRAELRSAA